MKKYVWLIMVALIITVPLLAACAGEPAPDPAPAPAPKPAPTPAPAPAPKPAAAPATPTAIPHPLEGRDDCLMCHETGVGGAAKIPADHAGRPNDLCTSCHKPAA